MTKRKKPKTPKLRIPTAPAGKKHEDGKKEASRNVCREKVPKEERGDKESH